MSQHLPRLYHTASSYYSMIARLALTEANIAFESHPVDIHRRRQQFAPDYVRMNPNMTVPTLVLSDRLLSESRDILEYALGSPEAEAATWVDRQYAYPIEELTFGRLLSWNPLARKMIPRTLGATEVHLRALAREHPDLAPLYERRARVFEGRKRTFDAGAVAGLYDARLAQMKAHLDALEETLKHGRATLVPSGYGPADVVWTVFLARVLFIRLGKEIEHRPCVARYAAAMFARPSFKQADVWDRIDPIKLFHQLFGA